MKKFLRVLLSIAAIFVIIIAGMMFYISRGLKEGAAVEVNKINVSDSKDGVYSGSFDSGRWTNELKVTVKDKKITDINIVKDVRFVDAKVRDDLFREVIEKQNTDVDILSGATVTSKAYLKSIENAFIK
jgi:uncharacterized protein with FMN-binding domain